jgi:5'-phosphate synthase pdxT subunit
VVVDEGWDKPSSASPAKKRKTSGGAAPLVLPSAADEGDAREIICAARKGSILVTAFHPELAEDLRWHEYFVDMVEEAGKKKGGGKKGGAKKGGKK